LSPTPTPRSRRRGPSPRCSTDPSIPTTPATSSSRARSSWPSREAPARRVRGSACRCCCSRPEPRLSAGDGARSAPPRGNVESADTTEALYGPRGALPSPYVGRDRVGGRRMKTGRLIKFHRGGADVHAYLYREGGRFQAALYLIASGRRETTPAATL